MKHNSAYVMSRVGALRHQNDPWRRQRDDIRHIMNGGSEAIITLLGDKANIGEHLPTVNLMDSGLQRLSQKLGIPPTLKVSPPEGKETDTQRDKAVKRQRIVNGYDELQKLDMQLPQQARWLAGYGFCVWTAALKTHENHVYPTMEIRDPYTAWPGYFGIDQHPTEIAFVREVDDTWLAHTYPEWASFAGARRNKTKMHQAGMWMPNAPTSAPSVWGSDTGYDASWEGKDGFVTLVEYIDVTGSYYIVPADGFLLHFKPNPLADKGRLPFVFAKRFAFDRLQGQYDHVIGIMSQMAKMNVLALIASEDAVFRETNIIGDMEGSTYERGRFATNFFTPGTRIERPGSDVAYQTFQQIDRLERQLRVGANYSVIEDSQSPNSFVTGQGLDRLSQASDQNMAEYQAVLRRALERMDDVRLCLDVESDPETRKPIAMRNSDQLYRARTEIGERTATKRMYGVMAGWDEPQKIVTGLQLLQGGIIDRETFQENLHGIDDVNQIRERTRRDETERSLLEALNQRAAQGDPSALAALTEIYNEPDQISEILSAYFAPQQEAVDPMAAALAQGGPPPEGLGGGPPPTVSTVLARLEGSGASEGGVQSVGRLTA